MILTALDWAVIVSYFVVSLGIGLYYSRRAGKNITEYFVSGRSLPWWLAGTSMVATTFAADTPLAVTSLVIKYGVAGNWVWWAMATGGMFTVFVFARLWRRAEVMTDVELVELRYGGKPAAFLRGFRSLYLAIPINCLIVGWVNKAMLDVLKVTIVGDAIPDWAILAILLTVTGLYTMLSGLWGVAVTDVIQFVLAMGGCIVLAVLAVNHVGGTAALEAKVTALYPAGHQAFSFLPDFSASGAWISVNMFCVYLFLSWWISWYPGAEPGGGGYIVQRMAACKDERHSLLATLWFQVAHYCLRPWPWLLVGFCALVMYPELRTAENPGVGFPMVMRDLLPAGLRGLLLVAFFAAYMSTLATQINWGASYLVSDFYHRFMRPHATDRHLNWASRIATVIVLVMGGIATTFITSVDTAWKFIIALGAGTGAVFMLRWFWWRINAWTEIAAMVGSFVFFSAIHTILYFTKGVTDPAHWILVLRTQEYQTAIVGALTVAVWLIATFATKPESRETLLRFYRKCHPGGPGWGPVAREARDVEPDRNLGPSIIAALFGTGIVYSVLPGVGFLIFGRYLHALYAFAFAGVCVAALIAIMNRIGWEKAVK